MKHQCDNCPAKNNRVKPIHWGERKMMLCRFCVRALEKIGVKKA